VKVVADDNAFLKLEKLEQEIRSLPNSQEIFLTTANHHGGLLEVVARHRRSWWQWVRPDEAVAKRSRVKKIMNIDEEKHELDNQSRSQCVKKFNSKA